MSYNIMNIKDSENYQKALVKGKVFECIIGFIFLLPPVLGVIFFVISVFGGEGKVPRLTELSDHWTTIYGMSAAPIYLALMAIAGAYLVKDSISYFFYAVNENKEKNKNKNNDKSNNAEKDYKLVYPD